MCQILGVARSGFYAWIHTPLSLQAIEDERLLELIRESYVASGRIYGSPRIFLDLREAGETMGRHRVSRIMRENGIRAVRGYKAPRYLTSVPSQIAPNLLQREFTMDRPDVAWVTDITYIRTWQGWLYLAVVMDLHSRMIIGWSMQPTMARDLVLDALLMAVWRRKPREKVIMHSDQGSQYGMNRPGYPGDSFS
jgi:putative transposase